MRMRMGSSMPSGSAWRRMARKTGEHEIGPTHGPKLPPFMGKTPASMKRKAMRVGVGGGVVFGGYELAKNRSSARNGLTTNTTGIYNQ